MIAMPITPLEIMLGKIAPYVLIGFFQASLIVGAGACIVPSQCQQLRHSGMQANGLGVACQSFFQHSQCLLRRALP